MTKCIENFVNILLSVAYVENPLGQFVTLERLSSFTKNELGRCKIF